MIEIIIIFLVFAFYPLLVLSIWTLIHRKDQRDYLNGCPEIYTIGDLIDACSWRSRYTFTGDCLTTPILGFFISLIITIFCIVLVVCKIFRWIFSLLKIDIAKIFSRIYNILLDLWDNFRNVKIFK